MNDYTKLWLVALFRYTSVYSNTGAGESMSYTFYLTIVGYVDMLIHRNGTNTNILR